MKWWPQEQWNAMVDGIDCPMCSDAFLPTNVHSELLFEVPGSYARLMFNQTKAGYTAVIAKRHAAELFDLSPEELRLFWIDVSAVAHTITSIFSPVKIDYLVMGHLCPHVHCHVYPQYENDDPHGLLNPKDGNVRLDSREWAKRVDNMKQELDRRHPSNLQP